MEEKIIKWLDVNELRILKQIIIIADRQNGESELGSIIYTRPMTTTYNLIKQKEADRDAASPIDRFLGEYPKQENYPADHMDEIILNAVRKYYPKSIVRNDTIFFNVDLGKLEVLKNRNVIESRISFFPTLPDITSASEHAGKTFSAPTKSIKIYSYYLPESLHGHVFTAYYDAANPKALDDLRTVLFE